MSDMQNKIEEIEKNIEVMESTFAANGLKVLSTDIRPFGYNGAFYLFVEIAGLSDALNTDLDIKINVYNDQHLINITAQTLVCAGFAGYDTLEYMIIQKKKHLATRIRIYAAGASGAK